MRSKSSSAGTAATRWPSFRNRGRRPPPTTSQNPSLARPSCCRELVQVTVAVTGIEIRRHVGAHERDPRYPTLLFDCHGPLKRSSSRAESVDAEDPLLGDDAHLRLPELQPGRNPKRATSWTKEAAPGGSRIAVILTASPRKRSPSAGPDRRKRMGTSARFETAVSAKQTPVPPPKILGWVATSSKQTQASAPGAVNGRGRPRGRKPGMSDSDLRGYPTAGARVRHARAKAPDPGFAKRRGRPPKAPSPPPGDIYRRLEPQFVAYLCEWAGCKAELHNLDTLRRHVYAVHGGGGTTRLRSCRWRKCAHAQPAREFAGGDEFSKHMEEAHLVPLAWHVGDGPRNGGHGATSGGDEIPDFFKDAQGKQVTPSVRDQELEDVTTWRMNRRRLKELLLRKDENLPDDDSESGPDER